MSAYSFRSRLCMWSWWLVIVEEVFCDFVKIDTLGKRTGTLTLSFYH